MTEEWRTAVYDGEVYEGLYKVSNLGKILSLDYNHTGKPGLMNPSDNGDGYLKVGLWKDGESKTCLVHRLVAEAFLENPENLPEVNHIDEDKTNNFVFLNEDGSVDKEKSNLEWKSHRDNLNHGTRTERAAKAMTNGKCPYFRILIRKVLEHEKRVEKIPLTKRYTPEEYPHYDNYDAIEVSSYKDIPVDYDGVMGVPISYLQHHNPNQFEIVGAFNYSKDYNGKNWSPKLFGKNIYKRILIKKILK